MHNESAPLLLWQPDFYHLQRWQWLWFWWNIQELINCDVFCIILQYWLQPDKLRPPITTQNKFISNTWILQLEVIAVIKTFLSLSVYRECYQKRNYIFQEPPIWYCDGNTVILNSHLLYTGLKLYFWKANAHLVWPQVIHLLLHKWVWVILKLLSVNLF